MARHDRYFRGELYPAYVPVAERKAQAAKEAARLAKKGKVLSPVKIEGRTIARSFWGKAWCDNLAAYSDYASRLPRGATYARNGSVIDLQIEKGKVSALVSGSMIYTVGVGIGPLPADRWKQVVARCSGQISSLVDLLQGKLSSGVMAVVTDRQSGLFPGPREITMTCSCPDSAVMCKHVAAVLYGVGARLDSQPELLFTLRAVDPSELLSAAASARLPAASASPSSLEGEDLSALFGVDIDEGPARSTAPASKIRPGGMGASDRGKGKVRLPAPELPARGAKKPSAAKSPSAVSSAMAAKAKPAAKKPAATKPTAKKEQAARSEPATKKPAPAAKRPAPRGKTRARGAGGAGR